MSEWQTIDTAPTNGTWVLIFEASADIPERFSRCDVAHAVPGDFEPEWFTGCGDPANPTHWMPLPSPPKAGKLVVNHGV